jgi:putative transcriptional regulator
MKDYNSIISYQVQAHGHIDVKLREVMTARGITRNRLSTLIGVKYDVVDRYYRAENIQMVDLDFLSRVCYVLHCDLNELLEYHPEQ